MTTDRTPGPLRALLLTIALLSVGCGSFETPVARSDDGPVTPGDPGSDAPPLYEEVEVEIVPSRAGVYPHRFVGDGNFFFTPAMGSPVYADFLVRGAPETVTFSWTVESGMLPPGLSLDPRTGEVSGVAYKSGDWRATIGAVAREVVDGKLYVARPYEIPIRVAPACQSDDECVVDGFEGYTEFRCVEEFYKDTPHGACTVPTKPETCPTEGDRVQIWVHQAGDLPPGKSLSFTARVDEHEPCTVSRFSLDAGGNEGYCVSARTDRAPAELGGDAAGPRFLDISYRLPRNYPAPLVEGRRYRFLYMRGNVYEGDHIGDGTLVAFEVPDGATTADDDATTASDDEAATGDLVLLAHTGRLLPDDLLSRCAAHGSCPPLPETHVMPTRCVAVAQASCGARTPMMLLARKADGTLGHLETGQRPLRLTSPANDARAARPYALHLALSDTFVGDEARKCADGEDDYRLSYYVLPTDACLLTRIESDDANERTAPARLGVERTEAFAPDGQSLSFAWSIEHQPATNALFRDLPDLIDGIDMGARSFDYVAFVPGYYVIRQLVEDDRETEACELDDTAYFSVVPSRRAYVELSRESRADLELRVAPIGVPWSALTGQLEDPRVASPANLLPDWGVTWEAETDPQAAPPFFQARAADLVGGAGVQALEPADAIGGRYRVGVLYRGDDDIRAGVVGDDDDDTRVTARVRVILDRNLATELSLDADLARCWFWEVGVLDLDAVPPTFSVSPHEPAWVCGRSDAAPAAFEHEARSGPDPSGRFDTLPGDAASPAYVR